MSAAYIASMRLTALLLFVGATLRAQSPVPAPAVTRADLAAAYQRVDAWLMTHAIDSAALVSANRRFDQSTLAFFGGRTAEAVQTLNRLYGELVGDSAADGAFVRSLGLRVTASPRVLLRGRPTATLEVTPVVPVPGTTPLVFTLQLRDARGRVVATSTDSIEPGRTASRPLGFSPGALGRLAAGRYVAIVRARGTTQEAAIGTIDVADRAPDDRRVALQDELATLDSVANTQALAAFHARLANLVSVPSADQSAQFLADPAALEAALVRELASLRAGRDPYASPGDLWRVVVGPGGRPLPVRVIVPPTRDPARPRPLVIALHGAGGDENMFPDAYGAGEVQRQAAARQAIVVSPATVVFQRDPAMFDSLVAVISRSYAIDTTRVYVVGHSMGAAAAYGIGTARANRIAATTLLNGAGRPPAAGTRVPPSLWIAGTLDPVIPPSRIRPAADAARTAGASVEYRERPTAGHTLGVGPMLAEAFAFLFARSLTTP